MKVKVSIMNTQCILMPEAVTMPSLMMMTSTVSEELLARDGHSDTQTNTLTNTQINTQHTHGLVDANFFQVCRSVCLCSRAAVAAA